MKHKILKAVALILVMASFTWMMKNPDWEPIITFLAMLSMLISLEFSEEKIRTKHPDIELYQKFIQNVPSTGSIQYLRDTDMRRPIDTTQLRELSRFVNYWDNAEHEFVNKEIEKKKLELLDSCNKFFGFFNLNTFHFRDTLQSVPIEWQDEQIERYNRVTSTLNTLADDVVTKHQELIKLYKKIIFA